MIRCGTKTYAKSDCLVLSVMYLFFTILWQYFFSFCFSFSFIFLCVEFVFVVWYFYFLWCVCLPFVFVVWFCLCCFCFVIVVWSVCLYVIGNRYLFWTWSISYIKNKWVHHLYWLWITNSKHQYFTICQRNVMLKM